MVSQGQFSSMVFVGLFKFLPHLLLIHCLPKSHFNISNGEGGQGEGISLYNTIVPVLLPLSGSLTSWK